MLRGYKIITVTHKNTCLKELGEFVVSENVSVPIEEKLQEVKESFGIEELMYLATCNRVMYFFYTITPIHSNFVTQFFKVINPDLSDSTKDRVEEIVTFHEGTAALEHLKEVAASVDSMVIGEREILRQVREAYAQSADWKLTGDNIRLAMKFTVKAAKDVYANTRIGEKTVSVVSLAIKELLYTDLPKTARILLVGAGQTNALVSKFLSKYGYKNVAIFNRTIQKAQKLKEILGEEARAFTLSELNTYDKGFDCMIVCTGATQAIIHDDLYAKLLSGDKTQKVVIDLSVPNNVSKEVVENHNVHYIEIENLRALAKENMAFREKEISKVKELLAEHLDAFHKLFQQRQIERAMRQVPEEIKGIKHKAVNTVFKKELDALDDETRELFEKVLTYMEKKCISIPMKAAKRAVQ